ncbi:molybdenum cofactor guanylyltransferase [Nocardioides campestrisoli]|uniref:molybdenum cofactor guanylyltransferase n=1 Tax=Nocardioides campestrisoli TaxID=2736757 RepID=UPI0015E67E02|nr:NTP transferase domain-containing protein [Nocardioides campestrisoli]
MSPASEPAPALLGVVLAGGAGRRLGGVDKGALRLGDHSLLDHAVAALDRAGTVVVVGSEARTRRPVRFTREEPPGGGPVAGLLAGLLAGLDELARPPGEGARAAWLAVLAVDMPWVTAATFDRLLAAAAGRDGAFLHGDGGRRQLCGVLALPGLLPAVQEVGSGHGVAVRRLLDPLDLAAVPARGSEARDVDTWADLPGGGQPPGQTGAQAGAPDR